MLVVHATYVAWIRAERRRDHRSGAGSACAADPNYVPERSFFLVINAPEQEVEIIHFLWAMLIIGYKALLVRRERQLLDRDLIHVPEGIKVLPEDAKDYARQLEAAAGRGEVDARRARAAAHARPLRRDAQHPRLGGDLAGGLRFRGRPARLRVSR